MVGTRADLAYLSEGQVASGIQLTRAEAVALNATRLVSVEPAANGWDVRAAYAVGALRCGELDVRVAPKVGAVQVLRLLARAAAVRDLSLDDTSIGVAADSDLTAVLAELFTREASGAMVEGPLRGYRSEDQTLTVVRGRIRVRDQELRRFGQMVPLEVTVDEWTVDTDENRRLRAATRRLVVLPGLAELTRTRLLRLDRQLAGVTVPPTAATLPDWTPTRLNARLHDLLALADLVLASESVEHRVGDVRISGFVLSMPLLFERLLTRLLVEATRDSGLSVIAQRSVLLDPRGVVTIRPDLTVLRQSKVVAVADVKYKLLDERGRFPNADAYQLVTYCSRLGLGTGHLVYAGGDPDPGPLHVLGTPVRLVTHAVNLSCSLEGIVAQVVEIAQALQSPAS